jgi:hypothetical protein
MSNLKEVLKEINAAIQAAKSRGCETCHKSIGRSPDLMMNNRDAGSCWQCRRLSNWEWRGFKDMRYDGDDWVEQLKETATVKGYDVYSVETGKKVIAKHVRPHYTVWKQTTVHKRIKASARRSRRIFKQYLRTGSLRLLKAAERKVTSWDFD